MVYGGAAMIYLNYNPNAPISGYWDQHIVEECFDAEQVFVIAGGANAGCVQQINARLAEEPYCLVIITSDEMGYFPWRELRHPNMKLYLQYFQGADRQIPLGGTPDGPGPGEKAIEYFFAGQTNTESRKQCVDAVTALGGLAIPSNGFAQGLPKEQYNELMSKAKIVPCPGGHVSPDSFRLYEALEAGCTPVVNNREYFTALFGDFPFPCVNDWSELADVTYQDYSGWWADYKQQLRKNLESDLWTLQSSSQAAR